MGAADVGARVAAAAAGLVGVPYRRFGRDPATGLDCVGLVVAAHGRAGIGGRMVPDRYRWREAGEAQVAGWLRAAGCASVADEAVGDILVRAMPGGQLHLLIALAEGAAVHAHAGLGRVVAMPAPLPGAAAGRWRATMAGGD